ncbi:MAG: lactate racemase domain-containing protein, partial [Rectinema sp.]|nr:lactate racemase domain-containing protein [Rectinema sp.]
VQHTIESSGAMHARKVLIIPPDITRIHSQAGIITSMLVRLLGSRVAAIMPALGTHAPMTHDELSQMYPGCDAALFRAHDWRHDVVELGRIPGETIHAFSEGRVDYSYPVQVNRLLVEGGFDLIISVGQVVPHEVAGMANQAKNIFVGTGGKEAIDRSHYLGAVCGMERIMGRIDNPVRRVLDEALAIAAPLLPPLLWILTVMGHSADGSLAMRGYFAGDDRRAFEQAAALSREVNVALFESPVRKAVVWLDPSEYRSTWLGNKAIYRLRMAMETGGELLILAPGLRSFGEDPGIDMLIRRYGYRTAAEIQAIVARDPELAQNMSAAAHLIHGSSEGRFRITYAPGSLIRKEEIESVGFAWANLEKVRTRYQPDGKSTGWYRTDDGEEFFFVQNPALGLWSTRERMGQD